MLRSLHIKLVLIMITGGLPDGHCEDYCRPTPSTGFISMSLPRWWRCSARHRFVRDWVPSRRGRMGRSHRPDPAGQNGSLRGWTGKPEYSLLDRETAGSGQLDDDGAQTWKNSPPNLLVPSMRSGREEMRRDLTTNYGPGSAHQRGGQDYIIYILDQRATVRELNSQLFQLIIEPWPLASLSQCLSSSSLPGHGHAHPGADPRGPNG